MYIKNGTFGTVSHYFLSKFALFCTKYYFFLAHLLNYLYLCGEFKVYYLVDHQAVYRINVNK